MSQTLDIISEKEARQIGGFELLEPMGEGATGIVFKARQPQLDRIVALKILRREVAQKDPSFVERLFREARVSAKLSHPNIVQGIAVGHDEPTGLYYFAMEWIDGITAGRVLDRSGRLSEHRALEIALGVAQALVCAHRAGIVHRDIKPDNILLTMDGETKLADLGLAKNNVHLSKDALDTALQTVSDARVTQHGAAVGTPFYMAPEQARGDSDKVDIRSDLYALGATLFHMLTGRPPFTGDCSTKIMEMQLAAPVPDARQVCPSLSAASANLILRLMEKSPAKRLQRPEELVAELEQLLKTLPKQKTPATLPVSAPVPLACPPRPIAKAPRRGPEGRRVPRRPAQRISSGLVLMSSVGLILAVAIIYALSRMHVAQPHTGMAPVPKIAASQPLAPPVIQAKAAALASGNTTPPQTSVKKAPVVLSLDEHEVIELPAEDDAPAEIIDLQSEAAQ